MRPSAGAFLLVDRTAPGFTFCSCFCCCSRCCRRCRRSSIREPAFTVGTELLLSVAAAAPPPPASLAGFDYRWQTFPRSARGWRHGADASAVTFRGHEVLSTLVRARFSPLESTGGRFAFGGSSDG